MKKILFIVPLLAILFMASAMTGCRFAKSYEDGDTVAASVFEPEDTTIAAAKRRHAAAKAAAIVKDSADFGRVVRVRFYLLNGTDSLVSGVEEVKL